jgi:endonuclease YncB( thermonuclease family)
MRRKETKNIKRSLNHYLKKPSFIGLLLVIFFCGQYCYDNIPEREIFNTNEVRVIDGDSIALGKLQIRLQGIDAPELKQECKKIKSKKPYMCGEVAKDYLVKLIDNRTIECTNEGLDRYQRQLAYCYIGKINLNSEMVRSGNAVAYSQYDKSFLNEEQEAKLNKVGMWGSIFDYPSKWRNKSRSKLDK